MAGLVVGDQLLGLGRLPPRGAPSEKRPGRVEETVEEACGRENRAGCPGESPSQHTAERHEEGRVGQAPSGRELGAGGGDFLTTTAFFFSGPRDTRSRASEISSLPMVVLFLRAAKMAASFIRFASDAPEKPGVRREICNPRRPAPPSGHTYPQARSRHESLHQPRAKATVGNTGRTAHIRFSDCCRFLAYSGS